MTLTKQDKMFLDFSEALLNQDFKKLKSLEKNVSIMANEGLLNLTENHNGSTTIKISDLGVSRIKDLLAIKNGGVK